MNARVFVKTLHDAGGEFSALSREIANQTEELEMVERELRKQSEFQQPIQALEKVNEVMQEERYKLRVLSEAIHNIGSLYQQTESAIEDSLDGGTATPVVSAGTVPLTELGQQLNRILYGK